MYDLKNYKGFEDNFPTLYKNVSEGHIYCYSVDGKAIDLTDEQKKQIAKLEDDGFDVYAVKESIMELGRGDRVHMTSYLLLGKEDDKYAEDNESMIMLESGSLVSAVPITFAYAMSYVINHTWDIEEMGSILITEQQGKLIRIG